MFGRVIKTYYSEERYVDHYIRLNIDNREIVNLLEKHKAPKECIYEYFDMSCELITRNCRYHDKWGNYWDNLIGKEIIIDL